VKGFFDKSEFSASYRDISERRNQATAFIGGAGGVHYRADNDFYATPPSATQALLNVPGLERFKDKLNPIRKRLVYSRTA